MERTNPHLRGKRPVQTENSIEHHTDTVEWSDMEIETSTGEGAPGQTGMRQDESMDSIASQVFQDPSSLIEEDGPLWRPPIESSCATKAEVKHAELPNELVREYHWICVRVQNAWRCAFEDFLPENLRQTTSYSFALLKHLRALASLTKNKRDFAHSLLLEARQERIQTTIAHQGGECAMEDVVETLVGNGKDVEKAIQERWEGLMLADVKQARELAAGMHKLQSKAKKEKRWTKQAEAAERVIERMREKKASRQAGGRTSPDGHVELVGIEVEDSTLARRSFVDFLPIDGEGMNPEQQMKAAKKEAKKARTRAERVGKRRALIQSQARQHDNPTEPPANTIQVSSDRALDDSDAEGMETTLNFHSLADQEPTRVMKDNKKINNTMSHHMRQFNMDPERKFRDHEKRMQLLKKRVAAKSKSLPSERFDLNAMPSLHSSLSNAKVEEMASTLDRLGLHRQLPLPS